ncbi:MAG: DnaA ATPase domain-containing protein [Longimicrobiales bacterium]
MVTTDLDPRFTFESFIVGPANRLACAAAKRAADAPGTSYNPLFIYSASGLGKSHILSSIANYAARVHPEFGVMYIALESFLEELTAAVRSGTEEDLRERYEGLHILLLDDVQFLAGQTEAQELLLRLLDSLSRSGSQIVLASDRPPAEMEHLDARLVSRFSGGLIVDIGAPEFETRVAILRRKADERGQLLDAGVAETLARFPFKNVRELAGSLNKILAIQDLEGRQVEPEELAELIGIKDQVQGDAAPDAAALLDEFGSFIEELSATVASKVEREETPWRRLLRQTAETFEADSYSGTRLRRMLELDEAPGEPKEIVAQFREDVERLREIAKELDRVGNPWPEAAIGLIKDPERIEEAQSLLASAIERVRPFPLVGEGPNIEELAEYFPPVAVKAAEQLVLQERPEYNPLYVWCGEQRVAEALMGATGRSYRIHDERAHIAVTSAEEFAQDFIRALSQGVAGAWRERWWTVDLLLVYGVQELSGTERAQDEFFHLFEAMNRRGAKVFIVADRDPSSISGIDDRLSSRFEMGLVVEVDPSALPADIGRLNLEEGPPEFIQDDDLWVGFDRPKVSDAVVPPLAELQISDDGRGGLFEGGGDWETGADADPEEAPAGAVWCPSRENVVWNWPTIEDRIEEDVD